MGEWTDTWYAPDALQAFYARDDLKGPKTSARKVVRGGSRDENKANSRRSFRHVKPPVSADAVNGSIGFRRAYESR